MPFWVKRVLLKSGQIVTERELRSDQNRHNGPAPVVGDIIRVECQGRQFNAKVIWGNWQGRDDSREPTDVVPLRVEEL